MKRRYFCHTRDESQMVVTSTHDGMEDVLSIWTDDGASESGSVLLNVVQVLSLVELLQEWLAKRGWADKLWEDLEV